MTDHIHRYRRVNIGTNGKEYFVMRCTKPMCKHYTAMATKLSAPLLMGNIAECNRCFERFILDKRSLRQASPCCADCVRKVKDPKVKEADLFFQELEKSIGK